MFKKVEMYDKFYGYKGRDTLSKFNRVSKNRKFVKILVMCLDYKSSSDIYPNVKNPLMHQVRDMARDGLLDRYVNTNDKREKYYYKTTKKGLDIIAKAYNI